MYSVLHHRDCHEHLTSLLETNMADTLPGTYQHSDSHNLETFLAATNVPMIARKVVANTSPRLQITREGDTWSMTFKVMIKTNTITFQIGKEFSESNPLNSDTSKVTCRIWLTSESQMQWIIACLKPSNSKNRTLQPRGLKESNFPNFARPDQTWSRNHVSVCGLTDRPGTAGDQRGVTTRCSLQDSENHWWRTDNCNEHSHFRQDHLWWTHFRSWELKELMWWPGGTSKELLINI